MAIRFYDCLRRAGAAGFIPAGIRSRWIPFLVGGVLLAAACLKTHRLFSDPPSSGGIFEALWFQVMLVEVEAALGLALWLDLWPRGVRWAAMLLFGCFLGAALSLALGGAKSCACFGGVRGIQLHPWLAVLLDIGLVALLAWWTPPASQPAERPILNPRYVAVLPLGALLAFPVALFGLAPWNAYPRLEVWPATIDLGSVPQAARRVFDVQIRNPWSHARYHGSSCRAKSTSSSWRWIWAASQISRVGC